MPNIQNRTPASDARNAEAFEKAFVDGLAIGPSIDIDLHADGEAARDLLAKLVDLTEELRVLVSTTAIVAAN